MKEVKFKGNTMNLEGNEISVGDKAPDFILHSQSLEEIKLSDFSDKIKIITTFPSLDTPVCDAQVRRFNKIASELSENIIVLGVSKDLPFAHARFCETNGIKGVITGSDYRDNNFGQAYGLLIKELGLLARSIMILDKDNSIIYFQLVNEVTDEPNFDEAIEFLKNIT
ncbi:MAG: thiol peroxidase [Pseudomonadota bacterium]